MFVAQLAEALESCRTLSYLKTTWDAHKAGIAALSPEAQAHIAKVKDAQKLKIAEDDKATALLRNAKKKLS